MAVAAASVGLVAFVTASLLLATPEGGPRTGEDVLLERSDDGGIS